MDMAFIVSIITIESDPIVLESDPIVLEKVTVN